MEHHVRQAPDHYTVAQALRYGETRGLGGRGELAREVASGWLGRRIDHSDFWRSVILFLAANSEIEIEHVNPIIDCIQANKFGGEEVLTEKGTATRTAPWPDFAMKGRTVKSILRLVSAWHTDLSANKLGRCFSWQKSSIQGYRFLEERAGEEGHFDWTIQELLDSGALHAEGRAMRHCVYTYADRCRRGETTIWSLRLRVKEQGKSLVTIEVDPQRRAIIQVRAKCNRRPGVRSCEIIRQWAAWAGLQCDLGIY